MEEVLLHVKVQGSRCQGFRVYFEGHGDLVSRLIMGMIEVIICGLSGLLTHLLSPHGPPSRVLSSSLRCTTCLISTMRESHAKFEVAICVGFDASYEQAQAPRLNRH